MTHPAIPASRDLIDEHVRDVVFEQMAHFQAQGNPDDAMSALVESTRRRPNADEPLWADVAGLIEDIYREDQSLPAKREHQYSVPRYKDGVRI